jgi:DNA-binding protein YbaB
MEAYQEQLRGERVVGRAGGLVSIEMNGLREVLGCKIDPVLFERADGGVADGEMIEDLVVLAVTQALAKASDLHREVVEKSADLWQVPGLSDAMSQLHVDLAE